MPNLSNHFNSGAPIPPDSILKIAKRYEDDPRENKIDAGVGVFRIEKDIKFVPNAIKKASKSIDINGWQEGYLSPKGEREWAGDEEFLKGVASLVFGSETQSLLDNFELAAIGTSGGTGALAVYAEALKERNPDDFILLSKPSWPLHKPIFEGRGIKTLYYNHIYNNHYDFNSHLEAIKSSPKNTIVLFHAGKTHNPTGVNPTTDEQWRDLAKKMEGRRALFDSAYAGFVDGLEEDTKAIRIFMEEGVSVATTFSLSKNAGLYEHRVGGLLIAVAKEETIDTQRLLNGSLRIIESSPSAFGEKLLSIVFQNSNLKQEWFAELKMAALELKKRREIFASFLPEFDFIKNQYGIFSMLPLNSTQIETLEREHGVYMTTDGRINFGGIPTKDIEALALAIQKIL